MTTRPLDTRMRRVVAATDGGDWARVVLEHAVVDAGAPGPCDLHIVKVLPKGSDDDDITRESHVLGDLLLDVAAQLSDTIDEMPRVWMHLRVGDAPEEIAFLAEEIEADAIVTGPPTNLDDSVAPKLVTMAPCSVSVIRPKDYGTINDKVCAACAEVRAESDGETWFCADHRAPGAPRLVSRIPRLDLSARPTQFG